jgi:hypothetical protein
MTDVLILGGYGNFGKRIAELLTRQSISVIIAGRDRSKAELLTNTLPSALVSIAIFDVNKELSTQLSILKPKVVINTCGPFQECGFEVAQTCIEHGVHYIDLADGREFVRDFASLNMAAKEGHVTAITGASTVPALSSAVLEQYRTHFTSIESLDFGIAPGQKAERGLATTRAILGYVGKKLMPCVGYPIRYGWQDIHLQDFPIIGRRMMANCDIPDLDLLPAHYGIAKIRFAAGMENPLIHLGIWSLSWLIRLGIPLNLAHYAAPLLKLSTLFDSIGSSDGGMFMRIEGHDNNGISTTKQWFIIGMDGDGPYIPTIPSVVLTKKLLSGTLTQTGAMACVGLVSLEEYLAELTHLNVQTYVHE